jgi:hypothetical protein
MRTRSLILAMMMMAAVSRPTFAQAGNRSGGPVPSIRACALLPASEVKRLIGLPDPLNLYEKMAPEEEAVGKGSSCNYPSAHVQIDPFDWATIDSLRAKNAAQFEAVPGVGDAAFLRANKQRSVEFAELYARVGTHILTIQLDVPDGSSTAAVKPGLVALATAYAAKLR